MTEFIARLREDAPDEEDLQLSAALVDLQAIVDDFLGRTGVSINDLNEDEQQSLVDLINPQLGFEINVSQDIYAGLPVTVGGPGGFLIADAENALLGAQQTTEGDILTGMIEDVRAYPVPSRKIMLDPTDAGENIATYDQSLSAVLIVSAAKFHSHPLSDGTFQIVHDLGDLKVVIPVVYGMKTRVSDIAI